MRNRDSVEQSGRMDQQGAQANTGRGVHPQDTADDRQEDDWDPSGMVYLNAYASGTHTGIYPEAFDPRHRAARPPSINTTSPPPVGSTRQGSSGTDVYSQEIQSFHGSAWAPHHAIHSLHGMTAHHDISTHPRWPLDMQPMEWTNPQARPQTFVAHDQTVVQNPYGTYPGGSVSQPPQSVLHGDSLHARTEALLQANSHRGTTQQFVPHQIVCGLANHPTSDRRTPLLSSHDDPWSGLNRRTGIDSQAYVGTSNAPLHFPDTTLAGLSNQGDGRPSYPSNVQSSRMVPQNEIDASSVSFSSAVHNLMGSWPANQPGAGDYQTGLVPPYTGDTVVSQERVGPTFSSREPYGALFRVRVCEGTPPGSGSDV